MQRQIALGLGLLLLACWPALTSAQPDKDKPDPAKALKAARDKGLDWLTKNQAKNGSWGRQYTIAVTSFACLAYLGSADEPFTDARGKALIKGLEFILSQQKDGMFAKQGHTWIHGQGFATLALSEAYGRSLLCKTKPDFDMKKVRDVAAKAVKIIGEQQSESGGWWYDVNSPKQHEGSTTVCAVQAIVSCNNFKIEADLKVLEKGFAYLKKCQNKNGAFQYSLGDGSSMKEGTAAAVATLGLMQKFDNQVMIDGYKFLLEVKPAGISAERFPYYGHFYGCMGMRLLGQEFKGDKSFDEKTAGYIAGVHKDMLAWQEKDGKFPAKNWVVSEGGEGDGYGTAFGTLVLTVPEGRLSIYNRTPPKLPK